MAKGVLWTNGVPMLSDAVHHPHLPPGTPLYFEGGENPPAACCCIEGGVCICIPTLQAASYPDLEICLTSNADDPCDECFAVELCGILTWNGTEYSGSVDFGPGGCGGQDSVPVRLACSAVTDDICFPGLACGSNQWELQMLCEEGCFDGCFTPDSCSPFSLSGTLCASTRCCITGPTPGFGCLDFEVTLAA
jgi:hypothetical protein